MCLKRKEIIFSLDLEKKIEAKQGEKEVCEESKAGARRMGLIYKQFQPAAALAAETCTPQQQLQLNNNTSPFYQRQRLVIHTR